MVIRVASLAECKGGISFDFSRAGVAFSFFEREERVASSTIKKVKDFIVFKRCKWKNSLMALITKPVNASVL
jgi:hypothetical protein